MHLRSSFATGIVTAGLLFLSSSGIRAQQEKPAAPDNTKVNKRDRSPGEPTADQAKDNPSDREIMQKIRKALVDDSSLSTYAHNVKVISQNGKVTLKGPVRSEEEKQSVEQKAAQVAGAGNVTNELTVKAARSKKTNQ
jgi:hyperosmotically inducible periplasmic protein